MNQIERIKPVGVTIKEVLQDNHRHAVFLVEQNDEERIYKAANTEEFIQNISLSVQNYHYINALVSSNPNSVFRPRRIYQFNADEGWFIGENFNVPPIFAKEPIEDHTNACELVATYMVPFLAEAAANTSINYSQTPLYSDNNPDPSKRIDNRMRELGAYAQTAVQANLISSTYAARLIDIIRDGIDSIKTGIELKDLSTWEMFILPEGKLGIVDLEHLDTAGRKHFDVVWQFNTLWSTQLNQAAARTLLREYRQAVRQETSADGAILIMLSMKFLGLMHDLVNHQIVQDKPKDYEAKAAAAVKKLIPLFENPNLDKLC